MLIVVYHLWTDSIKQPNSATFGNIIWPVNSGTYQADNLHVGNVSDHDMSGNLVENVSDNLHAGNVSDHNVSGYTVSGNTVDTVSDHLYIGNMLDQHVSGNIVGNVSGRVHVGNVSDHDVSGYSVSGNTVDNESDLLYVGNVSDNLHVGNVSDHDVPGNIVSGNIVSNVQNDLYLGNVSDHNVLGNTVSDDAECEHGEKRLPDCIIIGVQKGGTKALLDFLSAHPQVVRNELIGEYHFFDNWFKLGIEWYRKNMPCSLPNQIVIEKTPRYFRAWYAPKRVFQMDPNIKLLLIVRNPVQRALSMYNMYKRYHESKPYNVPDEKFKYGMNSVANMSQSFESSWKNYIQVYDSDFKNWLKFFRSEQIHIVDSAAFEESPAKELTKIEDFLKIGHYFEEEMFVFVPSKGFYCIHPPGKKKHCLGDDKGHHPPKISPSALKEMTEYLRPHNKRFYQLSGKHFDWD